MTSPAELPEWPKRECADKSPMDVTLSELRYARALSKAYAARLACAVEALLFVTNRQHLMFAECSDAEDIIVRVDEAMSRIGPLPDTKGE